MSAQHQRRSRQRQRGLAIVEYAIAGAVLTLVGAVAFIALGDAVVVRIDVLTDILK